MDCATSLETIGSAELPQREAPVAYSVIICTRNRADFVAKCLRTAIQEGERLDCGGEIIMVDNASTDETRSIFDKIAAERSNDKLRIRYQFEPEPGLSLARNRGVAQARGDILIFLDDDAVPQRGWLSCCLTTFDRHPAAMALGGKIEPLMDIPPPEWFRPPLTSVYTITDLIGDQVRPFPGRDHPLGANMAFRKSVFQKFCFSESLGRSGADLMSGEEKEICALIRRAGGEILYAPGMRVGHFIHPERLAESWAMERYYFEGVSLARLKLGRRAQAMMAGEMGFKIVALFFTRVFARSQFRRLLWQCRMHKSIGYFSQLIHRRQQSR